MANIEIFLSETWTETAFFDNKELLEELEMEDTHDTNNWHADKCVDFKDDETDVKSEVYKKGSKNYKCPEEDCDSRFRGKISLLSHIRKHHGVSDSEYSFAEAGVKSEVFDESLDSDNLLPCFNCNRASFENMIERNLHIETCQLLFKCNFCEETFEREEEKQDHEKKYRNSDGLLKCRFETCGDKVFKDRYALMRHLKKVHFTDQDTSYSCYFCGANIIGKAAYREHMKMYKDGPKNYKCPEEGCDSRFRVKISLLSHLRKHRGVFEYSCEICGKIFATKYDKKFHMKNHESLNLVCHICSKTFKNKQQLYSHIKRTHADSKDKVKYRCDKCEKGYPSMDKLKNHIFSHTGIRNFTCTTCRKEFLTKNVLHDHEKIHSGVKHYKCSICGKGFYSSNKVKRHELIHTGTMDFTCSICGKKFNQKINRNTHEKKCDGCFY